MWGNIGNDDALVAGRAIGVLSNRFWRAPEEVWCGGDVHIGTIGSADVVNIGFGKGNIDIYIIGNVDGKSHRYALR